jgi:citrate synthase
MAGRTLSSGEACALLAIRKQTLYAYVARGHIRSESAPGTRSRRYLREDVERLLRRREIRHEPADASRSSLAWGDPVLASSLTEIRDGRLYYRGIDALELAETSSLEEVALLLWGFPVEGEPDLPPRVAAVSALLADLAPLDRLAAVVAALAADDPAAWDPRPEAGAMAGGRVLRRMVTITTGNRQEGPIATALATGWGRPEATALVNAALIATADHELNVSAFTARCVASAGASVPDAITAGLCALKGRHHGGQTALAERLLDEASVYGAREAIAGRLRRGEAIPGFGHPLYPAGDPRGAMLLDRAVRFANPSATLIRALVEAGADLLGQPPNVDLGLAAAARVVALPAGAAPALFAIGRTVGWVAHALEQGAAGRLIRPRARYVGR